MPNPFATYSTLKFLWTESKPVREWLWSRLPSAQDKKKREMVEDYLASLMDDANALARALPEGDREAKIDERIQRFRIDLGNAKIPQAEIDVLMERATLFVRMLVTGPYAEVLGLRQRLGTVETALASLEKSYAETSREQERQVAHIASELARLRQERVIAMVALVAGFVVLAALILLR